MMNNDFDMHKADMKYIINYTKVKLSKIQYDLVCNVEGTYYTESFINCYGDCVIQLLRFVSRYGGTIKDA